ncbi:MAG TPA: hypothetical protein VJZ75_05975, partial [Candidatus Bathyarchaeia archaeon]|nr:hypothetical protein [Candidatus Bathyarchaeia archaeon]
MSRIRGTLIANNKSDPHNQLSASWALYQSKDIYALVIASISFGTSAIFVRFATEATALSLTFFRLSLAAIVMILFAYQRKALITLARKQV